MITQQNKDKLVTAIHEHQRLDQIQQKTWWDDEEQHGCHIGCCSHAFDLPSEQSNFKKLAEVTGIPEWMLRLSEAIFEGLGPQEAKEFSVEFCEALPVDTDLDTLRPAVKIARMQRLLELQKQYDPPVKQEVISAIQGVIDYWKNPSEEKRLAAESAAESAVKSAGMLAVRSAARSAWSARSARSAASSEAWSEAESAAWSASSASSTSSADWQQEADTLISILSEI